jgi:hypothetical protein
VRLRVGDIIFHPRHGVGAVYATNWRTTSVAFVAADDAEFDTRELSKTVLLLDKKLEYPRRFDNEEWRQPLAETNLSYWHKTLAWGLVIGKYPRDLHPQFLSDLKLKAKELQMLSCWNYPKGHPVWNSAAARESSEHFYNSNNRTGKATQGVLASRLEATASGGYVTRLIPDEVKYLPSNKALRLFYVARISLLELNQPRLTRNQTAICHHGIVSPDSTHPSCSPCLGISESTVTTKEVSEVEELVETFERLFGTVRFTDDRTMTPDEPMREVVCPQDGNHLEHGKRSFCEYHVQLKRNRNGKKVRDEAGNFLVDKKTGLVKKEFSRIIAAADDRQKQLAATRIREERDRAAFAYTVQYGDADSTLVLDYFGGKHSRAYWHGNPGIWKPYPMRVAANDRVELRCSKPTGNRGAPKGKKWWPILEPVYQKRDLNDFTYEFCPPSQTENPFQEYQFIHLDASSSLGRGSVNAESQRSQYNGRQVETNFLRKIVLKEFEIESLYAGILHKTERADEAGLTRADIISRRKKEADSFFRIITGASAFIYPYKFASPCLDEQGNLVREPNRQTSAGYLRCPHGWLVIGQMEQHVRWTSYCSICNPVGICEYHSKAFKQKIKGSPRFQVVFNPRNEPCSNYSETEINCRRCGLSRIAAVSDIQLWNARLIAEQRRIKTEIGEHVELSELFESNLYPQWGLHGWR